MPTLQSWLASLNLEKYLDTLVSNSIDLDIISQLTEDDLASIGITLGDRKRLLNGSRQLATRASGSAQANFQESSATAAEAPIRPGRPIGELRQMTIMFVDLVNSTGLTQELGIEKYRDILKTYQKQCVEAIQNNFGYFAQFVGDGVVSYFGFPLANEDDAERAALTALEIVDKVSAIAVSPQENLSVRIGIATGDVVVEDVIQSQRQIDSFALGDIPNLAARLQSLAEPGTVAVSERTQRLLGHNFQCASIGAHKLKGFSEPVNVWLVEGSQSTELRFEKRVHGALTPLIGRQDEFNLLQGRWNAACRGEGQAVFLSGEAGLGKSRLAEEVQQKLVLPLGQRLIFQCSPYHVNSSFFPIKAHIINSIGLRESDTAKERESKLRAFLEARDGASDKIASVLSNLLSLGPKDRMFLASPEETKARTVEFLIRYIEKTAFEKPILIQFEDLHWIDPSSEELLNILLHRIDNLRVMVLGTYRPEYKPTWVNLPKVTTLSIPSLGAGETKQLLQALNTDDIVLNGLMQVIVNRSEGIPLYVEEMVSMLARNQEANWTTSQAEHEVPFPSSLKDLLRARLDNLSVTPDTISICAALGRNFTSDLVAAVAERSVETIQTELASLVQAQIMVVQTQDFERVYSFRHALIGDVAYDAILPQQAKELHRRIAETMVERFENLCDRQPEILALHYMKAEQFDGAREKWREAAHLSLRNYASQEAIAQLTASLDAHENLARDDTSDLVETKLRQTLAVALEMRSWGSPDITSNLEKLIALNEKIGDHEVAFANLHQLIGEHLIAGRPDVAWQYCERMAALIAIDENSALHTLSEHNSGMTSLLLGEFDRAIAHFDQALDQRSQSELSEINRVYPADPETVDTVLRCWAGALKHGDQTSILGELETSIAKVRAQNSEFSRCYGLSIIATIYCTINDPEQCRKFAKEAHKISEKMQFKYWEPWCSVVLGWAEARCGQTGGVNTLREGLERYAATGSGQIIAFSHTLLADAYLCQCEFDEAAGQIAIARDVLKHSSIGFHSQWTELLAQKIEKLANAHHSD